MIENIDAIIFIGFLIATIALGLSSSWGITSFRDYAVGNKKFSTATIAATIVATFASGQAFFIMLSETYTNGLYFIFADCGDIVGFMAIGLFFAPRMSEFLNNLSIAEAMGQLYGKYVRIITAITGSVLSVGILAGQFQISGELFHYCFDCKEIYGIVIGGLIISIYSGLGGIRSVTFTDVVQLLTFATMLPTLTFFIFSKLDITNIFTDHVVDKFFNYKQVFNFTQPKSLYYLFLFLFNAIPGFNPTFFQRVVMAKDTNQIRRAFVIAGLIWIFMILSIDFISLLISSTHPNIESANLVKHVIFDQSYVGLRGFILAGLMAMVMSTADSYVNSTAVLFVHDICKPLGIKIKNELSATRITSYALGIFAIILALGHQGSLLQLLLASSMFYMPIVSIPFLLAVMGFRTSTKSVLIGMIFGAFTTLLWEKFSSTSRIPALVPGMVANLIFLFASHYILRQPGGWVGVKDKAPLIAISRERSVRLKRFIESLKNFNFSKFMEKNSPNNEVMYIYTGLFCFLSIYSNMSTVPYSTKLLFPELLQSIMPSVLFLATAMLSYPLWLESWKRNEIVAHLIWNVVAFYGLIFIGTLFAIISNFAPFQVMLLIISLIIIATLVRWQWALVLITCGVLSLFHFINIYFPRVIFSSTISIKLQLIYLLVLVGSLLIIFIKPKQEYETLLTSKVNHLKKKILYQEKEMMRALSFNSRSIDPPKDNYYKPLNNIIFMSQMLFEFYENLSGLEKQEAAKVILKSFIRLENFESNILNLSRLSTLDVDFNREDIDITDLINERLEFCRRLYEEADTRQKFVLNLAENIKIAGNRYYFEQMLDNLIINAIINCSSGVITITLEKLGVNSMCLCLRI